MSPVVTSPFQVPTVQVPTVQVPAVQSEAIPPCQVPRRTAAVRFRISVILIVAANTIRLHHLGREITLPIIAFSVITGIFLLGGGFGIMTTAAAGTDESEFERLLNAGETLASTDARNPAPGLPHPENPELDFLNRSSAGDTAA